MSIDRRFARTAVLAACLSTLVAIATGATRAAHRGAPSPSHFTERMADVADRDRAIQFYAQRAERDPEGALDLAQLAGLYLQRARETASHDDLHAAEDAARLSLSRSWARNGRSLVTLANALMGQHRFTEAAAVARDLVAFDPDTHAYVALQGEIALERGDDATARDCFARLTGVARQLSIAPRMARWLQSQGRDVEAFDLMQRVLAETASQQSELPREQLAWLYLRTGDAALRAGRGDADEWYRAGLAVEPADHRLWAARARLAAQNDDWNASLAYAQRATALVADVPALVAVHAAVTAAGDTARAAALERTMARRAARHEGVERAWLTFLLENRRQPGAALQLAQSDLEHRRDPQAWHLLAWALHANGRDVEARAAMSQAMRWGTREPSFMRCTAAIEAALGNTAAERNWLAAAAR